MTNVTADDRNSRLRERVYAEHSRTLSLLDKDASDIAQDVGDRRRQADEILSRELALLATQFCEAWKLLIVAGTSPQYKAEPAAFGVCTFGGRVPRGEILGGSAPDSFDGIDIQHAVLDTYEKLRLVGVPVVHIPGIGGLETGKVTDASHDRFNAKVEHDLPDCSKEAFEVIGYQMMIHDEGQTLRFSVSVWWRSKDHVSN